MSIDHISFNIPPPRYSEVVSFYLSALAPLNITKQIDIQGVACGLGTSPQTAKFWIGQTEDASKQLSGTLHFAFSATDREEVRRFHEEAVKAGGKDHGGPGVREMYHPHYYAAFVVDPLGNNVEVVCHLPQ